MKPTRKCLTPKPLARVIMDRQPEVIARLEENLRKKAQAQAAGDEWLATRTEGELVAFMEGYNACLETVMHEFNCYAGFNNYGPQVPQTENDGSVTKSRRAIGPSDPDYLAWRKLYYTNGIAKK